MDRKSILVVEDQHDVAQLISLHLSEFCDEVVITSDGSAGLSAAEQRSWGLIILDLGLPGIGGLEICRRIRQHMRYIPILMLTAKASDADRVLGLDMGADDCLTKPFCLQELLARVRAILRRYSALQGDHGNDVSPRVEHGGISIDLERREVDVDGKSVVLTATEFDLLVHFAQHPGRVYTRSQLLNHVWRYGHHGYEHTVNSHINRLRSKIEQDPSKPSRIVTVWGVGYRLGDANARARSGQDRLAPH